MKEFCMLKKNLFLVITFLVIGAMAFTACSGKKENSDSSASGSSQSASQSNSGGNSNTVMEVTSEAKARLEMYG
jgi:hypothetical protein